MIVQIEISEQDLKDLKAVRNYFGEHDKTIFEHIAYNFIDNVVKKLQQGNVSGRSEQLKALLHKVVNEFDSGEVSYNLRDEIENELSL
jgi:hypothetical protein